MKQQMVLIIRCLLTIALLVGVYFETGLFTTTALGRAAINNEIVILLIKRNRINLENLKWKRQF